MKNDKRFKVGDLVRLKRDLFDDQDALLASMTHVAWTPKGGTATKHLFESNIQLMSRPPGFDDDEGHITGIMGYNDVAMIIEFSDCSRLSTRILVSQGLGWIATGFLEST